MNTPQENIRALTDLKDPRLYREPKRITAARDATARAFEQIPNDMGVGLVSAENCPLAHSAGFYAPERRFALLNRIKGLFPVGGTPLADGLRKAGQMIDGVNREALILVISDGEESCNGDPCAVARELAKAKPHVTINVVDILSSGGANCAAEATGGKVYTAATVSEIQIMTNRAVEEYIPEGCTP